MIICPRCGTVSTGSAAFCTACGAPLTGSAATNSQTRSTPPSRGNYANYGGGATPPGSGGSGGQPPRRSRAALWVALGVLGVALAVLAAVFLPRLFSGKGAEASENADSTISEGPAELPSGNADGTISESPAETPSDAVDWNSVSFGLTLYPDDVPPEGRFYDSSSWSTGTRQCEVGITMTDQTGATRTCASVTIPIQNDEYYQDDDPTPILVGSERDHVVFYMWTGIGRASAFLYSAEANELVQLPWLMTSFEWTDQYLVGEVFCYGAGDPTDLYVFDWSGRELKRVEIVSSFQVLGNYCYYVTEDPSPIGSTHREYHVWKMDLATLATEEVHTITLEGYAYVYVDSGAIHIDDDEIPLSRFN